MKTRYFSSLLLVVLGTFAFAFSCSAGGASRPPSGDGGGGAPQTGAGGSAAGNDAASGNDSGTAGSTVNGANDAQAGGNGSDGMVSSDVAGTDGGSTDAAETACQKAAAVDRTCAADTDCVAVNHQTDDIGQARLLGIRSSEMAQFTELEMSCHATLQTIDLPATTADDGSLVDGMAQAVTCQAGLCTTYSQPAASPARPTTSASPAAPEQMPCPCAASSAR